MNDNITLPRVVAAAITQTLIDSQSVSDYQLEREEWAEKQIADALAQDDFKQEVADSALLGNIESPFNACMHQEHCKAWKKKASADTPATADLTDDQIIDLFHRKTTGLGRKGIIAFARAMFAAAPQPQSDATPYLYYDPENGDTWTQEAINDGCCPPDGLIALYTHSQRKPLTDERIWDLYCDWHGEPDGCYGFARAVECAHDIK